MAKVYEINGIRLPQAVVASLTDNRFLRDRWHRGVEGLTDSSTSGILFDVAKRLIRLYINPEDIDTALSYWSEWQDYQKGKRPDWRQSTIKRAYQSVQAAHLTTISKPGYVDSAAVEADRKEQERRDASNTFANMVRNLQDSGSNTE